MSLTAYFYVKKHLESRGSSPPSRVAVWLCSTEDTPGRHHVTLQTEPLVPLHEVLEGEEGGRPGGVVAEGVPHLFRGTHYFLKITHHRNDAF